MVSEVGCSIRIEVSAHGKVILREKEGEGETTIATQKKLLTDAQFEKLDKKYDRMIQD